MESTKICAAASGVKARVETPGRGRVSRPTGELGEVLKAQVKVNECHRVQPFASADKDAELVQPPVQRLVARVDDEEARRACNVCERLRWDVFDEARVAAARHVDLFVEESPRSRVPRAVDAHASAVEEEALGVSLSRVECVRLPQLEYAKDELEGQSRSGTRRSAEEDVPHDAFRIVRSRVCQRSLVRYSAPVQR